MKTKVDSKFSIEHTNLVVVKNIASLERTVVTSGGQTIFAAQGKVQNATPGMHKNMPSFFLLTLLVIICLWTVLSHQEKKAKQFVCRPCQRRHEAIA